MQDRHYFSFLIMALGMGLFWLITASKCSDSKEAAFDYNISDKTLAIANYERYCASCHGLNMERFSGDDPEALFNTPGAMASIYSYGHRNPQGLVKHPETGVLWSHEHGPRGGDEINIIEKGLNYG